MSQKMAAANRTNAAIGLGAALAGSYADNPSEPFGDLRSIGIPVSARLVELQAALAKVAECQAIVRMRLFGLCEKCDTCAPAPESVDETLYQLCQLASKLAREASETVERL